MDNDTKLTVSGYLRHHHKSLFKSNTFVLFNNIPIAISSLCTLYYYFRDYFQLIADDNEVSNNGFTIEQKWCDPEEYEEYEEYGEYVDDSSSYGKALIPSTKSICRNQNQFINNGIILGISSKPFATNHLFIRNTPTHIRERQ